MNKIKRPLLEDTRLEPKSLFLNPRVLKIFDELIDTTRSQKVRELISDWVDRKLAEQQNPAA
jgi:hypothetical protein